MKSKMVLRAGTAIVFSALSLPALAQSTRVTSGTTTGQGNSGGTSDLTDNRSDSSDIVVTAQRRSERLIAVPQSLTAVTGDDLAKLNAVQLRDYANTIPGLNIVSTGAGQTQLVVRGVTSGNSDVAATVGVYVDDVPYGGSTVFSSNVSLGLDGALFDLDRIELLRGPQGTLYGASSMGGLLKYVTRAPNLREFEGGTQDSVSFTRHGGVNYNVSAAASAPLVTDRIAVRASSYYSQIGGYIDNVQSGRSETEVGRARIYGGRLDVLFQPTDDLTIRIAGFAQNLHRDGSAQVDYTLSGQPVSGDLNQRRLLREPFDQRFRMVSGTIAYDFGAFNVTSISSYQNNHVRATVDASPLYVPLLGSVGLGVSAAAVQNGVSTDKFTQEVRLASSGERTVEWILGGFYTHESSLAPTNLIGYNADGTVYPVNLLTANLSSTYEEIAAFGDVTVHLTPKFDVTGGIRYARNNQSYTQNATGLLAPSAPTLTSKEDVFTYLANARYRFSQHATAYARFATGYRPGGPNLTTFDPVTGARLGSPTFQADTLESYELGFRGETGDRTFGIDASAYHIDWNNIIVSGIRNGLNTYVNAPGAMVDGAELTLTARPSRSVTASGAFAYANARLSAAAPDLGARKGERLPNVPEFTAAINADFQASGPGLRPTFGGTLRFVSDRKSGFDANAQIPQYDLGDYVTADLRAGASLGPIVAQVFVRNLFDERGALSAYTVLSSLGGPARVAVLQPRTIGIGLTGRF